MKEVKDKVHQFITYTVNDFYIGLYTAWYPPVEASGIYAASLSDW